MSQILFSTFKSKLRRSPDRESARVLFRVFASFKVQLNLHLQHLRNVAKHENLTFTRFGIKSRVACLFGSNSGNMFVVAVDDGDVVGGVVVHGDVVVACVGL